tara:strand:+ start:22193 stop:22666 length:474 start_codon:yes stop_codon:yes gene_type:complete
MKTKAFTILESIITLALISIIISMVYLVIVYFSKNVSDYTLISTKNFELNLYSLQLREDFFNSESVISNDAQGFTVQFYDETQVYYYQNNNFLYRKTPVSTDSLKITNLQIQYLFEAPPNDSLQLVKNLIIETNQNKTDIPLYFYKTYFSNYLNIKE